jgi:hypothetical protein
MGLINYILEKLTVSDISVSRLNANELIDKINSLGVERVVLSENEATELRKNIAERLGRELADTPLPDSFNGVQLVVVHKK